MSAASFETWRMCAQDVAVQPLFFTAARRPHLPSIADQASLGRPTVSALPASETTTTSSSSVLLLPAFVCAAPPAARRAAYALHLRHALGVYQSLLADVDRQAQSAQQTARRDLDTLRRRAQFELLLAARAAAQAELAAMAARARVCRASIALLSRRLRAVEEQTEIESARVSVPSPSRDGASSHSASVLSSSASSAGIAIPASTHAIRPSSSAASAPDPFASANVTAFPSARQLLDADAEILALTGHHRLLELRKEERRRTHAAAQRRSEREESALRDDRAAVVRACVDRAARALCTSDALVKEASAAAAAATVTTADSGECDRSSGGSSATISAQSSSSSSFTTVATSSSSRASESHSPSAAASSTELTSTRSNKAAARDTHSNDDDDSTRVSSASVAPASATAAASKRHVDAMRELSAHYQPVRAHELRFAQIVLDERTKEGVLIRQWTSLLQRRAQPPAEIRRFVDAFVDGFCAEYSIHSSELRAIAALLFARVVFPRLLLLRCVRFEAGEEREALANDVRLQAQLAWMRRLTPQELGVNPLYLPLDDDQGGQTATATVHAPMPSSTSSSSSASSSSSPASSHWAPVAANSALTSIRSPAGTMGLNACGRGGASAAATADPSPFTTPVSSSSADAASSKLMSPLSPTVMPLFPVDSQSAALSSASALSAVPEVVSPPFSPVDDGSGFLSSLPSDALHSYLLTGSKSVGGFSSNGSSIARTSARMITGTQQQWQRPRSSSHHVSGHDHASSTPLTLGAIASSNASETDGISQHGVLNSDAEPDFDLDVDSVSRSQRPHSQNRARIRSRATPTRPLPVSSTSSAASLPSSSSMSSSSSSAPVPESVSLSASAVVSALSSTTLDPTLVTSDTLQQSRPSVVVSDESASSTSSPPISLTAPRTPSSARRFAASAVRFFGKPRSLSVLSSFSSLPSLPLFSSPILSSDVEATGMACGTPLASTPRLRHFGSFGGDGSHGNGLHTNGGVGGSATNSDGVPAAAADATAEASVRRVRSVLIERAPVGSVAASSVAAAGTSDSAGSQFAANPLVSASAPVGRTLFAPNASLSFDLTMVDSASFSVPPNLNSIPNLNPISNPNRVPSPSIVITRVRSVEVCDEAGSGQGDHRGGADGDAALGLVRGRGSFGLGDARPAQRETDGSDGGGGDGGGGDSDIAGTRATAPFVSKDAFLPSSFGGSSATRHSALIPSASSFLMTAAHSNADADDADFIRARAEHPYAAAIDALEACVSVAAPSDLFRCLMACVQRIYRRAAEIEAQRAAQLAQRRRRAITAKMAATKAVVEAAQARSSSSSSSSSKMAAQADEQEANQGALSKEAMQHIRAQRRGATVVPSAAAAVSLDRAAMADLSTPSSDADDEFDANEQCHVDRARSTTGANIGTGDDSSSSSPSSFSASSMGADEFFPLMLCVLLHARLPRLHRTLLFMRHFARDEEEAGEIGYYFFTLQGAASFALDATPALYAPPLPPPSSSSTF